MKAIELREKINAQVIAALESGDILPWKRPWRIGKNSGAAKNVVSKNAYKGINTLILDLASMRHNFTSCWWGTWNQWRSLNGKVMRRPDHVREGEWGTTICFFSPVKKSIIKDTGEEDEDKFFVLKTFTIFNVEQVEGSHLDHLRAGHGGTDEDAGEISCPPAEDVIEASSMGMGVPIHYAGTKAYYSPSRDVIMVPPRATFNSPAGFYSTVLHELVHATEHPSRLDWSRKIKGNSYGMGELIAELGSSYLSREIGIQGAEEHTPAHVAYLADWLKAMKSDPKFLWTASVQSSRAADYILSFSRTPSEETEAALAC